MLRLPHVGVLPVEAIRPPPGRMGVKATGVSRLCFSPPHPNLPPPGGKEFCKHADILRLVTG